MFVEICRKHHRLCALLGSMAFRIDLQRRGRTKIMLHMIALIKCLIIMSNIKIFKTPKKQGRCIYLVSFPYIRHLFARQHSLSRQYLCSHARSVIVCLYKLAEKRHLPSKTKATHVWRMILRSVDW